MEIVLGTHHLIAFGGSDTYLVTVAEQLQRLGHEVSVHALEQGAMADHVRERGIRVAREAHELPDRCDALLVSDNVTALDLADRYPQTPLVFVAHSDIYALDAPPPVPDVTQAVVVMSDRVERHVAALAVELPIVRLHQPIDTTRFSPGGPLRAQAPRVAVVGNYVRGARRELLLEALDELGLEVTQFGKDSTTTSAPEVEMNEVDIVIGKSRVIVEAMACGRAAYLCDFLGTDGWVTPQSYASLEADAFLGQAGEEPTSADRLRAELGAYAPEMGLANRDLALHHHRVEDHVRGLLDLFGELAPAARRERDSYRDLALLSRQSWLNHAFAHHLLGQVEDLRADLEVANARLAAAHEETAMWARQREDEHRRADGLEGQLRDAYHALDLIRNSLQYRLGAALARPSKAARRRLGRS